MPALRGSVYIPPGWYLVKIQWETTGILMDLCMSRYHLSKCMKIYRLRSIIKRPELVNGVTKPESLVTPVFSLTQSPSLLRFLDVRCFNEPSDSKFNSLIVVSFFLDS